MLYIAQLYINIFMTFESEMVLYYSNNYLNKVPSFDFYVNVPC